MTQKQNGQSVRGTRLIKPDIPLIRDQFLSLRPAGGFRCGMVDAPWPFENRSPKGMQKNAAMHYPCMAIEDICSLPINLLFAEDAALFSWNVWPLCEHWMTVIKAWGFEFASLAWEWIKFNPKTGKYAFGPGYGTRKNLEPCFLLTRGNPSLKKDCPMFEGLGAASDARSVRDFIEAMPLDCIRQPKREHSRKPDEARARIQAMFDGPYIELFAREAAPGWVSWGNEVTKFSEAA